MTPKKHSKCYLKTDRPQRATQKANIKFREAKTDTCKCENVHVLRVGKACLAFLRALPLLFAADEEGSRGCASVSGGAMGPPVGTANSILLASAIACIVDKNSMVRVMLKRCRAGQIIVTHSPRGDHAKRVPRQTSGEPL